MTITEICKARNVSETTTRRRMRGVKPRMISGIIDSLGVPHLTGNYAVKDVQKAFAKGKK
jgi:hypothetical protein